MTEQKPNAWPKFIWALFGFSVLISCTVLANLGWYGLTGSGFSAEFPTWLPSVAAALTLICTIINISSTNPNSYEILIPDTAQVILWVATIVEMALFISNNGKFGSCTGAAGPFKSTCAVSQLVLWCGVALVHVSFAKLATAFYVRRVARKAEVQILDCEKQYPPPLLP